MTNDAKQEKKLNRICKKLQILTPVIQDAHKVTSDAIKFFITISVSLHGGALLILVNNSYKYVFYDSLCFIFGLSLSLGTLLVYYIFFDLFTITEKTKYILSKKSNIREALASIKIHQTRIKIFMTTSFTLIVFTFIYGVFRIFRIINSIEHLYNNINTL